jgi:hypothetical protein
LCNTAWQQYQFNIRSKSFTICFDIARGSCQSRSGPFTGAGRFVFGRGVQDQIEVKA